MPWFSYHGGHSGAYCRHARGTLAEVVGRAIEAGFTTYGLSEHCPRSRLEDRFPDELDLSVVDLSRMFEDYLREARRLRDDVADRIELLVGFETEASPPDGWVEQMRRLRGVADCDYIIGSVHHVQGHCIDYSGDDTAAVARDLGGREALEAEYFELVAQVAEGLRPEIIGHFDLIRKFDGDRPGFSQATLNRIDRALDAVAESGAALDVNAAPARRKMGPVYPLPSILERARSKQIPVTLGDDSHGPADVGVGLEHCMAAIAAAGYSEVSYFTRRDGEVVRAVTPIGDCQPR